MENTTQSGQRKRGPGRPPTKVAAPLINVEGVTQQPVDATNRLEFVYSDPSIFKSLFAYFKNIKTREIHLRCDSKGLTFFARDHSRKSRIVAIIAGEHVNAYYCRDTYWLGLNREHVEKLFASIDKAFYKITITQSFDDAESLTFVFKDADIDKECKYTIVLPSYRADEDLYDAENYLSNEQLSLFPIEFSLSAKQFKKTINDAANYSESITFEKIGNSFLTLAYVKANISYYETYKNSSKIDLRSDIKEGSIFRSTMSLSHIRSLANSMVTDDIRIFCREDDDILFRSIINAKALIVNTLIKIV